MKCEEDDDEFEPMYSGGRWEWNDTEEGLCYIAAPPVIRPKVISTIEFKDDMDIMEQQRFKKRYRRKSDTLEDVVTLQDVKDFVIYMTPMMVLSVKVINLLHRPATERFLRALILYMQYFMQVSEEMANRNLEAESKLRTPQSSVIEKHYSENVHDLRILVSREYCTMILGGGDYKSYHHMGYSKKLHSQLGKDQEFFESMISIFTQIVWVALNRKEFHRIESEINRLFRSTRYNEGKMNGKNQVDYIAAMSPVEKSVLVESCFIRGDRDVCLFTRSPMYKEVQCSTTRDVDFRTFGLGVVEYERLNKRLQFMEDTLILPEIEFSLRDITLGIIGIRRDRFDIVLKGVKASDHDSSTTDQRSSYTFKSQTQRSSKSSSIRKGQQGSQQSTAAPKNIPDIVIPNRSESVMIEDFPSKTRPHKKWCHDKQRRKWLSRLIRWKMSRYCSQENISTYNFNKTS